MFKLNNYGFLISLSLHLLIVAIPVSVISVSKARFRHFKEIELFVMDERPLPIHKKESRQRPEEIPKPVVKEVSLSVKNEPERIDEKKETVILNTIEPEAVSDHPDAAPLGPEEMPNLLPQPIVTSASVPQMLEDVEFGSQNAPGFLHREMPVYPIMARRLGKEGRVLLRLTIDEKGNLLNIEVLEKAGYGFTEAALEAVKRSTFTPAKIGGKAVMSKALLSVRFTLRMSE